MGVLWMDAAPSNHWVGRRADRRSGQSFRSGTLQCFWRRNDCSLRRSSLLNFQVVAWRNLFWDAHGSQLRSAVVLDYPPATNHEPVRTAETSRTHSLGRAFTRNGGGAAEASAV